MSIRNKRLLKNGRYGAYILQPNGKWKWGFISNNQKGGRTFKNKLNNKFKREYIEEERQITSSNLSDKQKKEKKLFLNLYYAC